MWGKLVVGFLAGVVTVLVVVGIAIFAVTAPLRGEAADVEQGDSGSIDETALAPSHTEAVASGASVLEHVEFSAQTLLAPDANVRDVDATADVVTVHDDLAVAQSLALEGLVPFELVESYVGDDVTVEHVSGDEVKISRRTTVLGVTVPLAAQGRVFVDGGNIAVEPTSINLGGPQWLQRSAGSIVEKLVTISQPVNGLPPGLNLDSVSAAADGFEVALSGKNVELHLSN